MTTEKNCGNTHIPEYGTEEPCELTSLACTIYEGVLPFLSLPENSNGQQIIDAIVSTLSYQSAQISTINSDCCTEPTTGPVISGPEIFEIDLTNYLGVDYSSSTTTLTSYRIASGEVLGGKARIKGNWTTQPTITGATEQTDSTFTANQVIYLYVEKKADGVFYKYKND